MATTLPVMDFATLEESPVAVIADKARIVLGYKRLARAYTLPSSLLYALRELEIPPLVTQAVYNYKAKKAKKGTWRRIKLAWAFLGCAISFALGAATINTYHLDNTPLGVTGMIICILLGIASGIATIGNFIESGSSGDKRTNRTWERYSIHNYDRAIPLFVLNKAIAIKEKCPSAELIIEQLVQKKEGSTRPLRDPFLVATMDHEEYYIDVWDEREYERTV